MRRSTALRLGRRGFLAGGLMLTPAAALTRPKYGGQLRLKLPVALGALDPHVIDDMGSALFAPATFDTLYALDASGAPFPALALKLPEVTDAGVRVQLRAGLKTAQGKRIDANDIAFSLSRSAASGGTAWLSSIPAPVLDRKHPDSVLFANVDPNQLASVLAGPITAIVPRGFNRLRPDGTGAFNARVSSEGLTLTRNDLAARGPAFLDRIVAVPATDLSDALRAFETGDADIGWLGKGLHKPRTGAESFDAGALGWIVLHSGARAGAWGRPGVAQELVDQLPPARFTHLGLRAMAAARPGPGWGGPSGQLLVDRASAQLVELASIVASLLGRPGHELTVTPVGRTELRRARSSRQFLVMLDFVRSLDKAARDATAALYTAAAPALGRHPPRLKSSARIVARALPLGVLGEVHAYGAHLPSLVQLGDWDLAGCWQMP